MFYRKSGHVGIRRFGRVDPGRPPKVRKHRLQKDKKLDAQCFLDQTHTSEPVLVIGVLSPVTQHSKLIIINL